MLGDEASCTSIPSRLPVAVKPRKQRHGNSTEKTGKNMVNAGQATVDNVNVEKLRQKRHNGAATT